MKFLSAVALIFSLSFIFSSDSSYSQDQLPSAPEVNPVTLTPDLQKSLLMSRIALAEVQIELIKNQRSLDTLEDEEILFLRGHNIPLPDGYNSQKKVGNK